MSVLLIKGMKMPKNCGCCPLAVGGRFTFTCMRMIGKEFSYELAEQRQEDCPLVEVPPHGDLIDRNELLKIENITCVDTGCWQTEYDAVKADIIRKAPTVLEAST